MQLKQKQHGQLSKTNTNIIILRTGEATYKYDSNHTWLPRGRDPTKVVAVHINLYRVHICIAPILTGSKSINILLLVDDLHSPFVWELCLQTFAYRTLWPSDYVTLSLVSLLGSEKCVGFMLLLISKTVGTLSTSLPLRLK